MTWDKLLAAASAALRLEDNRTVVAAPLGVEHLVQATFQVK